MRILDRLLERHNLLENYSLHKSLTFGQRMRSKKVGGVVGDQGSYGPAKQSPASGAYGPAQSKHVPLQEYQEPHTSYVVKVF